MDNMKLAELCRDPEEWSNIEPAERRHIADTLEWAGNIPRMAYHLVALRALLEMNRVQFKQAGRDTLGFDTQIADINNVLAGVQDIPEVQELLFPSQGVAH